jgi:hypothetical protein
MTLRSCHALDPRVARMNIRVKFGGGHALDLAQDLIRERDHAPVSALNARADLPARTA